MAENTSPSERTFDDYPKVIVGLRKSQLERSHALADEKHTYHIPSEAEIALVDPYVSTGNPLFDELVSSQALQDNSILVLSPFNTGKYAPEDVAPREFEREKIRLVSHLCRLLGATRVESQIDTLHVEEVRQDLKVRGARKIGRIKPYSADVRVSLKDRQEIQQRLEIVAEYPAGQADIEAAERYVHKHRLHDGDTEALIQARAGKNPATSYVIRVAYDTKYDSCLQIAGQVKVPTVESGGSYSRNRTSRRKISLDLRVIFGE